MSRTDNTMPIDIQQEDGKQFPEYGGCWSGIGRYANRRERTARQRARLALRRGEQPEPTRHRRSARYDYW